ncbi:MAG: hypothetical protein R3F62_07635 [Planctomycetota bacterium]
MTGAQAPTRSQAAAPDLALLGILALAALLPCLRLVGAWFVEYDDPEFLLRQRFWIEPSWSSLLDVWTRPIYGSYHPLHQTSYVLDRVLFGPHSLGPRLTNLALYAAILVGFASVGRRLGLSRAALLLGGLLYAWHPSHVENVAWISQRKDLLSAAFLLAAAAVYLGPTPHGLREPNPPVASWPRTAAALGLMVLGLLGKSVTVVLAPWLILIALGRGNLRREASRLACFVAVGAAATLVHYVSQDAVGAAVARPEPLAHVGRLLRALGFYAGSAALPLWPAPLLPYDAGWTALEAFGVALCAGWAILALRVPALRTWGLMAWVGIGPVWGLVPLPTFVQDRYLLWATLPLAWAAGQGLARLGRPASRRRGVIALAAGLALGGLWISVPYAESWRDARGLWTRNARLYPELARPRENLCQLYLRSADPGERSQGLRLAQDLLAAEPTRLLPNLLLGEAAFAARDYARARRHFEAGAQAQDNTAYRAVLLLANLELELGRAEAAANALASAEQLAPADAPELLGGRAAFCLAQGELSEARALAARAAARLPEWSRPWKLGAEAARRQGDLVAARALTAEVLDAQARARLEAFLALQADDLDAAARALDAFPDAQDLEAELARACYDARRGALEQARSRRAWILERASPRARARVEAEPAWPLP